VAVASVLLTLAAVNYFDFGRPTTTESPPVESPAPSQEVKPADEPLALPPENKPPTEAPPETLEENIESLMEAIAAVCADGEAREVTLVLSEKEANAQASELIVQTEVPEDIPLEIKDIYIDFQPGNSVLTEIDAVALGSLQATVKVKSQVDIIEGKPAVAVTEINFGFIPLSGALKDRIAGLVREKIEDLLNQLTETGLVCDREIGLVYQDIDIQEEEAAITVLIQLKV